MSNMHIRVLITQTDPDNGVFYANDLLRESMGFAEHVFRVQLPEDVSSWFFKAVENSPSYVLTVKSADTLKLNVTLPTTVYYDWPDERDGVICNTISAHADISAANHEWMSAIGNFRNSTIGMIDGELTIHATISCVIELLNEPHTNNCSAR